MTGQCTREYKRSKGEQLLAGNDILFGSSLVLPVCLMGVRKCEKHKTEAEIIHAFGHRRAACLQRFEFVGEVCLQGCLQESLSNMR